MPSETYPCDGTVRADVRLAIGQITVTAAESGHASASVEPSEPGDNAAIALAEASRISFDNGHLVVALPDRFGWRRGPASLHVRLALPPGSSLTAASGVVTVTTEGVLEDVVIKAGVGTVVIDEATGVVNVKVGDGTVEVASAASVALKCGRGDVRVGHADDVFVKTGQGKVDVQSSSGTVVVKGAMVSLDVHQASSGEITFEAAMGSAHVGVVAGTTVELDLSSATGDARCELPMESDGADGKATLRVRLRTTSGDVVVDRAWVTEAAQAVSFGSQIC